MTISPRDTDAIVPPIKLAHIALRTSRYEEVVAWYMQVFGPKTVFRNERNAFLTYDDEHHRVAILNFPGLPDQPKGAAGVHHISFTYATLPDLLGNYERLRDGGIVPALCMNHGPTTSFYYADPDGNQIELQVDNYETVEEAVGFFDTDAFQVNPIGVDFDPEDLLRRFRAGEADGDLKRRPDSGPRSMEEVGLH